MKIFNSEFLEKDFPDLEVAKITPYNVLREKGSIEASLVFTNHPDNLASGSAFRKAFPEAGEKFRWHTALRVEKQLFAENETLQTISNETGEN